MVNMAAVVNIPPYNPLFLTWRKLSNGYYPSINIKSDKIPVLGSSNVVTNSKINPDWRLSRNLTIAYYTTDLLQNTFTISLSSISGIDNSKRIVYLQEPIVETNYNDCQLGYTVSALNLTCDTPVLLTVVYENCSLLYSDYAVMITINTIGDYNPFVFYYSMAPPSPPDDFPIWLLVVLIMYVIDVY